MDNPGLKNLGEKNPITAAIAGDVITLAPDSTGTNQPYIDRLTDMGSATFFVDFEYGSGGTTAIVVIDTSLDQGSNWIEIARFDFATEDRIAAMTVSGAAPADVSTLAALGAEGKRDGFLGDRLRARLITTGTYAGNTSVKVRAFVRSAGAANNAADELAQYVDGLETLVGATNTAVAALNALLTTQAGYLDGVEGKLDLVASQTTLAAILAKIIAAPATEAKQDTGNTSLGSIVTLLTTQAGYLDGIEGGLSNLLSQIVLAAGTNLIGKVAAQLATDTILNGTTALTPKFAKIAASSSGDNTIVAAVTAKKIRVLAYNFVANAAVNAKFQSGAAGTDLTGLKYMDAQGAGICAPFNPVGWFETGSGVLLNLNLSGAVAVGGELVYVEV